MDGDYHPELSNTVFVKPTILDSSTNLTVITNQHVYYFHLTSNKKLERNPFTTNLCDPKFIYQPVNNLSKPATKQLPTKTNPLVHPKALNSAYRFSGSPQLIPLHVFDDGKFTYFELSPNGAVPAIFAVDDPKWQGINREYKARRQISYCSANRPAIYAKTERACDFRV